MLYLIRMKPLRRGASAKASKILTDVLGPKSARLIPTLIIKGGTVAENLNKKEAEQMAKILSASGISVEVVTMKKQKDPIEPKPKPDPKPEPKPEPENDAEPAVEQNRFIVFGRVRTESKESPQGIIVQAFDRDLRSQELLGKQTLDEKGNYSIIYDAEQIKRKEKKSADIVVRAYGLSGTFLVESDIHFNAKPEQEINLIVPKTVAVKPSKFEQLQADLKPLLDDLSLSELTKEDAWFLSNESEYPTYDIACLIEDDRLASSTGIEKSVFFALAQAELGVVYSDESSDNDSKYPELPRLDLSLILEEPTSGIINGLKRAIKNNRIPASIKSQLKKIEQQFDTLRQTAEKENLGRSKKHFSQLFTASGISKKKATLLSDHLSKKQIQIDTFKNIVEEEIVSEKEAKKIQLICEVDQLTQHNDAFTKVLLDQVPSKLKGKFETMRDLAVLNEKDWEEILTKQKIEAPSGKTKSTYASELAEQIETKYPTSAFKNKLLKYDNQALTKIIKAKPDSKESRSFAQSYKYMGVEEVLKNKDLKEKEKIATLAKRVTAVDSFFSNNPDLEIGTYDFVNLNQTAPEVSYKGIEKDLQPLIKQQMMAYQRIMAVSPDSKTSDILLSTGYDSAHSIAADSVRTIASKTGIAIENASVVKQASQEAKMNSVIKQRLWLDASSLNGTGFSAVPHSNSIDHLFKTNDELKNIIGAGSYCSCEHCASIFSPAAYFVDLMGFIERHVEYNLENTSTPAPALKDRRPDLWNLELTCENSTTMIPYLDIINSVLEQFIGGDVYQKLSTSVQSFSQPFNLPLEQLSQYLEYLKVDLLELTKHTVGSGKRAAQVILGLSPQVWEVITQSRMADAAVLKLYGMNRLATRVRVQNFIKTIGITRDQLDNLLNLKSIENEQIKIVLKEDSTGMVYEDITNLTLPVLRRIYLFIKLWKQLPWEMLALDYILRNFSEKYLAQTATKKDRSDALIFLASLRDIQMKLGDISIEKTISLTGTIPNEPTINARTNYFDTLFNQRLDGRVPEDLWTVEATTERKISPESKLSYKALFAAENHISDPEEMAVQDRVLRAVSVNETELKVLITNLFSPANGDDFLVLTLPNLSLIYKHALLAKQAGISINALFSALKWLQNKQAAKIENLDHVRDFLKFIDWQEPSEARIQDLASVLAFYADKADEMQTAAGLEFLRSTLNLDSKIIQFIVDHPSQFNIIDGETLQLDNLRLIYSYIDLKASFEKKEQLLVDYLMFPSIDAKILGALLDQPKEQIQTFIPTIPSDLLSENGEGNRIDILHYLIHSLELGNKLGLDGKTFPLVVSANTKDITEVQALLLNSIRSKEKNEDEFKEKITPYLDKLRNRRRDALVDYLLNLPAGNEYRKYFSSKSDLYYYFLLDTELEACASSSLVVAATNSIQLYLHRCFMGLEDGINPSEEMIQEWPWRKNYRVWEANRKVFLYPENYLEPDLRDNKTPAFLALEKSLLQQNINQDTVEAAYTDYLKEFTTVANLKIIGSCDDPDTKTTHFFGRNPAEPERIFHREMRKIGYNFELSSFVNEAEYTIEWSPWKELSTQINAKYLSPIVIEGRLHIFWVERILRVETKINGDDITSINHSDYKLKLSRRNLDGTLSQPMEIELNDSVKTDKDFLLDLKVYPYVDSDNIYIIRRKKGVDWIGFSDDPSFKQPDFYGEGRRNYFKVNLFSNTLKTTEEEPENKRLFYLERLVDNNINKMRLCFTNSWVKPNDFGADVAAFVQFNIFGASRTEIMNNVPVGLLQTVMNSQGSYFMESDEQSFLFDVNYVLLFILPIPYYKLISINTPVAEQLFSKFLNKGLEDFLTRETQQFSEPELPFTIPNKSLLKHQKPPQDQLDFSGAYGIYYQELFLHIPLLIANHLNANQHFEEAQRWYHYIFNPVTNNLPPTNDEVTNGQPAKSNVWNYLEFLKNEPLKMEEVLQDEAALEKYKHDPFNPHAIARLRMNAYQRSVAMKYIDNLIDWGDHLFTQDTRESINEATLLYIMAADILGERPVKLGSCEPTGMESKNAMTYSKIKIDNEFLPVFENIATPSPKRAKVNTNKKIAAASILPEYQQAFCIPDNKDMIDYWDRVADRLFKIRNCMNISGLRRELALFAPPIDPALLVKAKAAGLSIEAALELTSPDVPNHRFVYLLDKAKSFSSAVQSFGSALLSAMRSKDAEELTLLRSTHQKNILNLGTQLRNQQVKTAEENLELLELRLEAVEYREGYYKDLIETGLLEEENEAVKETKSAAESNQMANFFNLVASMAQLSPDVGSPLAFLYGGKNIGPSMAMHATAAKMTANEKQNKAAMSSTTGSYTRREQGWKHQKELNTREKTQLEKQIIGAEIRLDIAKRELEVHEENIAQADELYDFYRNRFSNSGLFNWLASELNTLHRTVYNMAHDLALQAQKAYNFERDDQVMDFIQTGHWDTQRAGLLAGERLSVQLRQMEKSYLETDLRKQEIDQTFSLTQLSPTALLNLKTTGECEFSVPELFFDLFYPGQYRRKIKSVRLTIPSVTGPYTNISAVLSLNKSYIRMDTQSSTALLELPNTLFSSISTSTAQNDAGVFELNFNGAKYMPFEGAGAVSEWNLSLPKTFRQFDYNTINDVVIHISYTAEYDASYRETIEAEQADQENAIVNYLTQESNALTRAFSFRQEFSTNFHRLTAQEAGRAISLKIQEKHFPFFLHDKELKIKTAMLILITSEGQSINNFELKVNEESISQFTADPNFANLFTAELGDTFKGNFDGEHAISILEGGDLAPNANQAEDGAIDTEKLEDIILYIEYYLA